MTHEQPLYWFGPEPWGPALDDDLVPIRRVAVPVDQSCSYCDRGFRQDDSGILHGVVEDITPETLKARVGAVHRNCLLRQVLGPDADRLIARLRGG